ncbi:eCIS core domain-containing protein [Paracoccus versutus]
MKARSGPVSTRSADASRSPAAPAPAPAPVSAPVSAATGHDNAPQPLNLLQRSLVGGAALPASLRARMETGFGASFSDVRIHTGGAAAQATGRARAQALTSGSDIAFAPGRYRPGSTAGDSLIAHELAHVVQQRRSGGGGAVQAKSLVSNPGDAAETAADTAAATVLAGGRAQVGAAGQSLRGRIMRRALAGAAPFAVSPALSQAPARPGAVAPGAGPVLTPMMTSQVSAAGGQVSGLTRPGGRPGATAPASKAPDDSQTARGENAAEAKPAPSVAIAGAPAGAAETAPDRTPQKKKDRDGADRRRTKDEKGKAAAAKDKGGPRAKGGGGGGGGGGAKRFGQNLGDRGEAAAEEARERLSERADALQVNEGADARIGAARAAAEPAPNAAEADGQSQQAGSLAQAAIPAPDAAAAQQRAGAALASAAPSTIEELDNFAGPGGAGTRQQISAQVAAEAGQQAAPVQSSMSAVRDPPAGAAPPPAVPQPAPVAAPATAAPGLTGAAPPAVPEESLDASEFREAADEALAEHDVDDATLAKAEEGPLRAIGDDKDELNENVDGAATDARATETAATQEAAAGLAATEAESVGGMEAGREAAQEAVSGEQTGTRSGEETGQRSLAEQINATYATAEGQVNEKLGSLESDAVQSFRDRQGQRLEAFASGVRADLEAFKARRYTGAKGLYNRARDWLLSINSLPEVKALYDRHRNQYIADIDALLNEIRGSIQRTIDDCKAILAEAKAAIDQLVEANKGNLDAEAQAALTRAQAQFQAMESRIEATQRAALAALDRERERAIREMDAKLAEIQAENAGLVDRIAAAIKALADALGEFMALMARVTRMGIGAFLSAAGSQAQEGVKNHLWDSLKEAFKEWFFNKVPGLQLLMNLPPNWVEMLTALATSMIGLITESLPLLMPAMAGAAMIWLATQLALKLIPGAGAIMAVIDAIRAAWSLVQSLFSAARAFLEFVMQVAAPGNGAAAFARALAHGIVAAVDMVLTFLGVDALIRRLLGAIARPFGRIVARIQQRFRQFMERRRRRSGERRAGGRGRRRDDGDDRGGSADARRDRRAADRRQRDRDRGRDRRRERSESDADRRRRRRQEEERRQRERLDRAVRAIQPQVQQLARRGVSRLGLGARLTFWRLRYRLTSLERQGDSIVARINPSSPAGRIAQLSPARIGRALEPILREAERLFEQERASNPAVRAQSAELERQMREGREVTAGAGLNEADVVFAGRRFLSAPGQLPLPLGRARFGRFSGPFHASISMPGSRPAYIRDVRRSSMLFQANAPAYEGFRAEHLDSPDAGQLRNVVEPIRAPGQLAARATARSLEERGMIDPRLEAARGEYAPMAPRGASVAADQDFRGRQDRGSFTRGQIASARQARHRRTGNIFKLLDRVLRQQAGAMTVLGEDQALRDLAQAFRSWALSNVSRAGRRASTPAEQAAAAQQLIASMVAFLRSRYP